MAGRFPDHGDFAEGVVAQQRTNAAAHPRVVFALAEVYAPEALATAFAANRPASGDSRQFGPVPGHYLIGCGWLTYWPTDR